MSNVLLGYPNRINEATLAGGWWVAGLPLSMLKNRVYPAVARSADLVSTSTQFTISLPVSRGISLFALAAHTLSDAAQWRVTVYSDAFTTVAQQTAWTDAWADAASSTLEWENDNFWTMKLSAEDIARYTSLSILLLSQPAFTRWLKVEILDTTNTAGYVQIGRCLVCDAWQPRINMSYGHSLQYETDTTIEKALDGTEYFNRQRGRRVAKFTLDWLDEDEAMTRNLGMQRDVGIDGEIVLIDNPAAAGYQLERQFVGRLRQLSAIENPYYAVYKNALEIVELI